MSLKDKRVHALEWPLRNPLKGSENPAVPANLMFKHGLFMEFRHDRKNANGSVVSNILEISRFLNRGNFCKLQFINLQDWKERFIQSLMMVHETSTEVFYMVFEIGPPVFLYNLTPLSYF